MNSRPAPTVSARTLIGALSAALVLCMTGFMPVAAVLPQIFADWGLSESEAGWLTGAYFGGYAAAVPFLVTLTDRVDARRVILIGLGFSAAGGLGFALFAHGLASGAAFRALAGVGLAGTYMPGLKLLADRLDGAAQARGPAFYISTFSVGSGVSFLAAGAVIEFLPWPWVFTVTGIAALVAFALVAALVPPAADAPPGRMRGGPDFGAVLANREVMRYVIASCGHIWEVFALRSWSVVFFAFSAALPDNHAYSGWNFAILTAVTTVVSLPASVAVAELAVRGDRRRVIMWTALASVAVGCALATASTAPFLLAFALVVLYSLAGFADTASIATGVVGAASPAARGATLAVYALAGFGAGMVGPYLVGAVLEAAGGRNDPAAWPWAWLTTAAGSLLVAGVMRSGVRGSRG